MNKYKKYNSYMEYFDFNRRQTVKLILAEMHMQVESVIKVYYVWFTIMDPRIQIKNACFLV
ncbi:hypothetical protein ACYUJ6_03040 [Clostridium sp. JNZ X4-2]